MPSLLLEVHGVAGPHTRKPTLSGVIDAVTQRVRHLRGTKVGSVASSLGSGKPGAVALDPS